MNLSIRGKHEHVSKKEIRYAVRFMCDKLMSPQLVKNLDIRVNIVSSLGKYLGTCSWEDHNHKPREFIINVVNWQKRPTFLRTLGHEIVHIKQYAKGELKDMVRGPSNAMWFSKPVTEEIDYWFLPWEIEARGYEDALFISYKNHLKEAKITFKV